MMEVKIQELGKVIRQELEDKSQQKKPEPHFHLTVYQDWWSTQDATVTYDSLLSSSTNIEGAVKQMVLETGVLTCSSPKFYKVSYSGQSELNPGDVVVLYLHRNGQQVEESHWTAYTEGGTIGGHLAITGAKTMV